MSEVINESQRARRESVRIDHLRNNKEKVIVGQKPQWTPTFDRTFNGRLLEGVRFGQTLTVTTLARLSTRLAPDRTPTLLTDDRRVISREDGFVV